MRPWMMLAAALSLLALVAYGAGVFAPGPAMPAATTPEECYAATVAAADKPNPTNVPCDWTQMLARSTGSTFNGRYESATAGVQGRLVIMELDGKPARLALSTAGESPRFICTAALAATRTGDTLVARPPELTGCEMTVSKTTSPNVVSLAASEACAAYCNMRGRPGADFKRVTH